MEAVLILVAVVLAVAGIVAIVRGGLWLGVALIVVAALVFVLRDEIAMNTEDDTSIPVAVVVGHP